MSTPEGFLEALRQAKAQYPEAGSGPLVPLAAQPSTGGGMIGFGPLLLDFLAVPYEVDGKLYDRYTDPEYLRWLKMFRQATSEGLIPMDVFADNGDMFVSKVGLGRYFALLVQWIDLTVQTTQWDKEAPGQGYIAVEGPRNQNGAAPTLSAGSPNGWLTTMVSSTGEHPQNAIEFMTYMISPEGLERQVLGIEGESYEVVNGQYARTAQYLADAEEDSDKAYAKYGVNAWAYFCTQPQANQFFDETTEAVKRTRDIYKQYCTYTGAYDFVPFEADSPELQAEVATTALWDETLPKLLMAESDGAFDTVVADFVARRQALGFDLLVAGRQAQLDVNREKISRF
jgi:putative aldouronate transport system substrate-binding protein